MCNPVAMEEEATNKGIEMSKGQMVEEKNDYLINP